MFLSAAAVIDKKMKIAIEDLEAFSIGDSNQLILYGVHTGNPLSSYQQPCSYHKTSILTQILLIFALWNSSHSAQVISTSVFAWKNYELES